jgi:hypothetical protein
MHSKVRISCLRLFLQGYTKLSCLNQGVGLCVNRSHAMLAYVVVLVKNSSHCAQRHHGVADLEVSPRI